VLALEIPENKCATNKKGTIKTNNGAFVRRGETFLTGENIDNRVDI
jgi:hypothetical protein